MALKGVPLSEEHKRKISGRPRKSILRVKYPTLPDELNRARKLTKEQVKEAIEMCNSGSTIKYVSQYFEVHYGTIYRHLNINVMKQREKIKNKKARDKAKESPDIAKKKALSIKNTRKYSRKVQVQAWRDFDNMRARVRYQRKVSKCK